MLDFIIGFVCTYIVVPAEGGFTISTSYVLGCLSVGLMWFGVSKLKRVKA